MEKMKYMGRERFVVFFHKPEEPNGYLSNWYPAEFTIEGIKYSSSEQYIMQQKCLLFGDKESAERVMATDNPQEQQDIGRKVKEFDDDIWMRKCRKIAHDGIRAKFEANKNLRDRLVYTGDAVLAECSKSDRIWGIGIGMNDDKRLDYKLWQGRNILGEILASVRRELVSESFYNHEYKLFCDVESLLDKSGLVCLIGDITLFCADCIVNPANSTLLGGGGADGAIHRAAGEELLKECRTLGGCQTGEAKITKGYNLPAQYIIHTVGPIYNSENNKNTLLSDCYKNSLNLAKKHNAHSIVFPLISAGAYGYPVKLAGRIAKETISKWLDDNPDYTMRVCLVCYDQATYEQLKESDKTIEYKKITEVEIHNQICITHIPEESDFDIDIKPNGIEFVSRKSILISPNGEKSNKWSYTTNSKSYQDLFQKLEEAIYIEVLDYPKDRMCFDGDNLKFIIYFEDGKVIKKEIYATRSEFRKVFSVIAKMTPITEKTVEEISGKTISHRSDYREIMIFEE